MLFFFVFHKVLTRATSIKLTFKIAICSNFLSDGAETKEPEKLKLKDGVMQVRA